MLSPENFRPEDIRPYPKAPPRKNMKQRSKVTTKIITTTPEKDRLLTESITVLLSKKSNLISNLTHVRDIFKTFFIEKNEKEKKIKKDIKKEKK